MLFPEHHVLSLQFFRKHHFHAVSVDVQIVLGTFCVRSECWLFQVQVHISNFDG